MLHQSDEVIFAQLHERRRCLLAEAAAERLAHRLQPPLVDRLLAALGRRLVQWGSRLQTRAPSPRVHLARTPMWE
jgi:hypothetical protein